MECCKGHTGDKKVVDCTKRGLHAALRCEGAAERAQQGPTCSTLQLTLRHWICLPSPCLPCAALSCLTEQEQGPAQRASRSWLVRLQELAAALQDGACPAGWSSLFSRTGCPCNSVTLFIDLKKSAITGTQLGARRRTCTQTLWGHRWAGTQTTSCLRQQGWLSGWVGWGGAEWMCESACSGFGRLHKQHLDA